MVHKDRVLLRVSAPKWLVVAYTIGFLFTLALFVIAGVHFARRGFTWSTLWIVGFFLTITLLGMWIIPLFHSSYVATESGLEHVGLFGRRRKFSWEEITRVSRPRFGIPYDVAYVFSERSEKITLVRGIPGYTELLELIQSKAPNLDPKHLSQNLWVSQTSWKSTLWIVLGVLGAYLIFRLIVRF